MKALSTSIIDNVINLFKAIYLILFFEKIDDIVGMIMKESADKIELCNDSVVLLLLKLYGID